jgi:uncharacterized protein YycO
VIQFSEPAHWQAGDVLLFHASKFGWMTWAIHTFTHSRWNHAALYLGDGKYVEATSSGVKVSDYSGTDEVIGVRLVGLYDDADDRDDVLAYAAGRVDTRYGYFNAFWCGLRHVFPGTIQIKFGDSVICSELVAESLSRAGFSCGKDAALVSPGDLAVALGIPR